MRSLASALLALALCAGSAAAQTAASAPGADQVEAATRAVRADPLLGGVRKERTLRWKDDGHRDPRPPPTRGGDWLLSLAGWLAESARMLMWVLGALAAALVLVLLRRWVLVRGEGVAGGPRALPSHVRDLDIRPESLPEDIAAAARALWLRGEQRASLSLLYRGALSRLVHVHAVPIRAASTEGECVRLGRQVLPPDGAGFFERLVKAWLVTVYAARAPEAAEVMALCDAFERCLPARGPETRMAA